MVLSVFRPSDFAIINTDRHTDFDIESRLSLHDQRNRKLHLSLNYVYVTFYFTRYRDLTYVESISRVRRSVQNPDLLSIPCCEQVGNAFQCEDSSI